MRCRLLRVHQILLFCLLCITFLVYVLNNEYLLRDIAKKVYSNLKVNLTVLQNNLIMDSDKLSIEENLEEMQKLYPNVPFQLLGKINDKEQSCKMFTNQKDNRLIYKEKNDTNFFIKNSITLNNQYWQEYRSKRCDRCISKVAFYLYSAYLDNRQYNGTGSAIRIIAMLEKDVKYDVTNYCLIWYDVSSDPVVSDVPLEMTPMGPKWKGKDSFVAYLLTCYVPRRHDGKIPKAVSIIEKRIKNRSCYKPYNYLKVIYNYEEKKDFAVCVKGLNLLQDNDLSAKFVQWIEVLKIMGADKIFLYEWALHPDIQRVLNYYAKKGVVDLTKISLPGNQPNEKFQLDEYLKKDVEAKRVNLNIHLNDCFYRNIHRYKFIAIIDSDEVIVPREKGHTWIDLMKTLSNQYKPSNFYWFKNTYFFEDISMSLSQVPSPDIPNSIHMLRHVYRSKNYLKGKSFISTEEVKTVGMHRAFKCLDGHNCNYNKVNENLAHVAHYRIGCQTMVGNATMCLEKFRKDVVWDTTLWEFEDVLVPRCKNTYSELGLKIY